MSAMASQITSLMIVYSTVYSGADQRKKAPCHWSLWGEFAAQRASNAEKVSIWWRHHGTIINSAREGSVAALKITSVGARTFFCVNDTYTDVIRIEGQGSNIIYQRNTVPLIHTRQLHYDQPVISLTDSGLSCVNQVHTNVSCLVSTVGDMTCYTHTQFWWQSINHWAFVADQSISFMGFSPLRPW